MPWNGNTPMNVLFLIHGVGRQSETWATDPDGPIETLNRAAQAFSKFKGKHIREFIDFVPIRYDDIFDKILAQWANLGEELKKLPVLPGALEGTLKFTSKMGDDKNLLFTYGFDVALYRGFRLFGQRVQLRVISEMARVIANRTAKAGGTPPAFGVIAHSLGTCVAHDSIHLLGSENWLSAEYEAGPVGAADEAKEFRKSEGELSMALNTANPFRPGTLTFNSVFMLSNTSELLQTVSPPSRSIVCPLPANGASAPYCQSFYSVDHFLDPISKVKAFSVPDAWKPNGRPILVEHLYEPNIHAFSHYLLNPKVHIPILAKAVNGFAPTPDESRIAREFPQFGGRLEQLLADEKAKIKARLTTLIQDAARPAADEISHWLEVYGRLREIAEGVA